MKRRNPLLAGFFNVLIPGSSHLYVSNNWLRFILFFVVYSLVIFGVTLLGNNIQDVREYTLPQGLCTGTLLLGIFAFLFYSGMKMASERNSETDSAVHYQSMRTHISKDDPITRLAKLQRQRDEGLISSEQQETKKAEIESKKK
jgi:ABC-type multidrug transport system permease subunit